MNILVVFPLRFISRLVLLVEDKFPFLVFLNRSDPFTSFVLRVGVRLVFYTASLRFKPPTLFYLSNVLLAVTIAVRLLSLLFSLRRINFFFRCGIDSLVVA